MTQHLPPDFWQHNTHEQLVGHATSASTSLRARTLDAIIVPASRPAHHLVHAVRLAQAADCRLVILCSRQAYVDDVKQRLESWCFNRAIAFDLPADYSHRWLEFATSRPDEIRSLPEACAARNTDLSTKRNLGLILARMLGWNRVFFMDDDITNVSFTDLRHAVAMLGQQYHSVGMRVKDFPDNSVVCHAHRETGEQQDVFVSGSVLAIDCTAPIGFFPDVYNEDWLFFYNDTVERKLAWSGTYATQLRYDPFDDPQRAAGQEFGDVLAEGLYALLHRRRNAAHATRDYWAGFLEARREFLEAITGRAASAGAEMRQKLIDSVAAAQKCLAQIEPAMCEHYVRIWGKDLVRWEQTLEEIPRLSSLTEALSRLGFTSVVRQSSHDGDSIVMSIPAKRVRSAAAVDQPTALDQEPASLPGLTNAAVLSLPSEDSADLAQLQAAANSDQMDRLRSVIFRIPTSSAARASQVKRLVGMNKMVRVLMMVGVVGALVAVTIAWQ